MTWVKWDDGYDESEKVEDAWDAERATIGLHAQATTCCARRETDGVVPPRWLKAKLPERRERQRVLAVMVKTRLFDVLPAGETVELPVKRGPAITVGPFDEDRYLVHDYLDHNDSSAYLQARRAADSERKAAGGRNGNPNGFRADSKRNPSGIQAASESPDPTRPDPTTSARGAVRFAGKVVSAERVELAERLLDQFNELAGTRHGAYTDRGNPSESLKRILGAITDRSSVTEEEWKAAATWALTKAEKFWQGKPDTGVVYGPGVIGRNLESATAVQVDDREVHRKLIG